MPNIILYFKIYLNTSMNEMLKNSFVIPLFFLFVFFQSAFVFGQNEQMHNPSNDVTSQSVEHVQEIPEYDQNFYFIDPAENHPLNPALKETDTFQAKFLNMLFILALLIGFMILASWALKKMMKSRITQINQASSIKVLETRQLSPKSVLYLIEVEGEILLIGESPTAVTHIASFPAAVETKIPPFPQRR